MKIAFRPLYNIIKSHMVCSPHIGVLAGIASGGTPSYNFPLQAPSIYQRPSPIYNEGYQDLRNSRRSYELKAIENTLYDFQKNSNDNQLSINSGNTFAEIPKLAREGQVAYNPQEQSYLPAAGNVVYQSPMLAMLAQAYTEVLKQAGKSRAKNQLRDLIDMELAQFHNQTLHH